jgi:hypothetical protein
MGGLSSAMRSTKTVSTVLTRLSKLIIAKAELSDTCEFDKNQIISFLGLPLPDLNGARY